MEKYGADSEVRGPATLLTRAVTSGLLLTVAWATPVFANPQGAHVAHGQVGFSRPNTSTLEITNSPNAIINWNNFSIGKGETTRFIQQRSTSQVLNRVVTQKPSSILGNLISNGRVFLINPNGMVFGPQSVVDTAGFVGSTLNMTDKDFLAGKFAFKAGPKAGKLVNQGLIRSRGKGGVYLIAPSIENSGIVRTDEGALVLAAGRKVTLSSLDLHHVSVEVQAPEDDVLNLGQLLTGGGAIGIFAGSIRNHGVIEAKSVGRDKKGNVILSASKDLVLEKDSVVKATAGKDGGKVRIEAGDKLRIVKDATVRADGERGGRIELDAGSIETAGHLSAKGLLDKGGEIVASARSTTTETETARIDVSGGEGGRVSNLAGEKLVTAAAYGAEGTDGMGGRVELSAPEVELAGTAIDASGSTGGGTVRIGGEYQGGKDLDTDELPNARTLLAAVGTDIKADALIDGDGGEVIVWSDDATRFLGTISARGGSEGGKGGLVETSGAWLDVSGARVDTRAADGTAGTWLLDPINVTINAAGPTANVGGRPDYQATDYGSVLEISDLHDALIISNVTITTGDDLEDIRNDGSIRLADTLDFDGIGGNRSLSLFAQGDVIIDAPILDGSPGIDESLSLSFHANDSRGGDPSGDGGVDINASIHTGGGSFTTSGVDFDNTGGSISTAGGDVRLSPHSGAVTIGAAIDAGDVVKINAGGAVTQTESIRATLLELLGSGPYTLDHDDNDIATLAASTTGDIFFSESSDLEIGTVGATSGVETPGDFTLKLTRVIAEVTQTAPIKVAGLKLLGDGGHLGFKLTDGSNEIATLAASTAGWIYLAVTDGMEIGMVGGTAGVTTSVYLVIDSGGPVTQIQPIQAPELALLGNGPYVLTNAGNDIDTLAADTTSNIRFTNATDLEGNHLAIGNVGGTDGVTSTGTVTLESDSISGLDQIYADGVSLTLRKSGVALPALTLDGALTVEAQGAITQTGPLDIDGTSRFDANANPIVLTDPGNEFTGAVSLFNIGDTYDAELTVQDDLVLGPSSIGGNLTLSAGRNLYVVAPISARGFVSSGVDFDNTGGDISVVDGDISLAHTGSVVIGGQLSSLSTSPSGLGSDVTLDVGSAVTQVAPIVASGLELLGSVPYTLTNPNNNVIVLAANTTDDITFVNSGYLAISRVSGTGTPGITSTGTVTLEVDILELFDPISANALDLTLRASGIALPAWTFGGDLSVTAAGAITQLGPLDIGGESSFDANANAITLTNAANNFRGAVSLNNSGANDAVLRVGGGLGLGASSIGGDLTLNAGGDVTQIGPLVARGLALRGSGAYDFSDSGNDVDTFAADTSGNMVDFRDADGFDIGSVSGISGVTGTWNLFLDSDGPVTQSAPVIVRNSAVAGDGTYVLNHPDNDLDLLQSVGIGGLVQGISIRDRDDLTLYGPTGSDFRVAGDLRIDTGGAVDQLGIRLNVEGLELLGTGAYTLDDPANDLDTLAANTSARISIVDSDGFDIGTVGSTLGVAVGGDLTLDAGGAVTQTGTGSLRARGLELLGSGSFTLDNAANDIETLAANTTGRISFTDLDGFRIGSVGSSTGVTTTDNLILEAGASVTQDERIEASGLLLNGVGPYALTHAANDVDILAARTTGDIALTDLDDISIGTVGGTVGVTSSGTLTLTASSLAGPGPISVDKLILNLGAWAALPTLNLGSDLNVSAQGAITQSGVLSIGGTSLLDAGANPIDLGDPGNDFVGPVSVATTGDNDVVLADRNELQLAAAGVGRNLTLRADGAVTQSGALNALGLELLGSGPFDLGNPANDIDTIAASATGDIRFTDVDDLAVGTVGATTGVTTTGSVSLTAEALSGGAGITAGELDLSTTTGGVLLPALDLGGDFSVTAAGPIGQAGALHIRGVSSFDAGANPIDLGDPGNDFVGAVSVTTAGNNDVRLTDRNGLVLGASAVGGDLHLDVFGPVSQAGPLVATGIELFGAGPFSLTDPGNDVDVLAASPYAGGVDFRDRDDLVIGKVGAIAGIDAPGDVGLTAARIDLLQPIVAAGSAVLKTADGITLGNDIAASRITLDAGTSTVVTAGSTLTADSLGLGRSVTGSRPLTLLTQTSGRDLDIGGVGETFLPAANVAALSGFAGGLNIGGTIPPDPARVSVGNIAVSTALSVQGDLTLVAVGGVEVKSGGALRSGGTLTVAALDQHGQGDILDPVVGESSFFLDAPTLVLFANDRIGTANNPLTIRSGPNTVYVAAGSGVAFLDGEPGRIVVGTEVGSGYSDAFSALGLYVADTSSTKVVTPALTLGVGADLSSFATDSALASAAGSDYVIELVALLGREETEDEKRKRQNECSTW